MPFIVRPSGETDLANATIHAEEPVPQTIPVADGQYQVGRVEWFSEVVAVGRTLSLNVIRAPEAARFAPEVVWLEISAAGFGVSEAPANSIAYDPTFHEIEYLVDWGDPGDTFAVPENLLPQHRDANTAPGKKAAHVYRTPGTYTITVTARRVTNPLTLAYEEAVATTQVTVGDPDTIFDATNTVVVAHDDDFTGAPPSNHQLGSTAIDGASAWYQYTQGPNITKGQPLRVLFKRGGNYSNSDKGFSHRIAYGAYTYIHYAAWGSGEKPIGSRTEPFHEGVPGVWQDLIFEANYDGLTEANSGGGSLFSTDKHAYHLLTGCELRKDRIGFNHDNIEGDGAAMNVLHDCALYELQQYGLLHYGKAENYDGNGNKNRLAVLGCLEYDLGETPHGQFSPNGQKQGSMRGFEGEDVVIQGCEFFVRTGWTGQGTWSADGVPMTAVQPVLRFAAGQPSNGTQRNGDVVVSRCVCEGGSLIDKNVQESSRPSVRNTLIEQCISIAAPSVTGFGKIQNGATTYRSNLHIKPNVADTPGVQKLLEISSAPKLGSYSETQRLAEPMRIYNNTWVLLDDSTLNTAEFDQLGDYVTTVEDNNVLYVPNNPTDPRHEDIAPFDGTELWASRYLGRREWIDSATLEALQTAYATPAGTISLYAPTDGSAALTGASGVLSLTDITGAWRTSATARGAVSEGAPAVVTTPADVFAGHTDDWFWFDMTDASSLRANTDGTGDVSVGGAVARVNDLSGNGIHITQSTAGARAARQQASGTDVLRFDPATTADWYQSTVTAGTDGNVFVCCATFTGSGANSAFIVSTVGSNSRFYIWNENNTGTCNVRIGASPEIDTGFDMTDGLPHVYRLEDRDGTWEFYIDGVSVASGSNDITGTSSTMAIGAQSSNGNATWEGDIYGMAFARNLAALSAQDRADLDAWAASLAGITLP